jgi:hypothetical protein
MHAEMRARASWLGLAVWLGCCSLFGCAQKTHAVACTCTYGGEAKRLLFPATREPYAVLPVDIGERFRLKVVYLRDPWRRASLNVYAYAQSADRDVLLQEGKYLPPFSGSPSGGRFGFTGRQLVYSAEQRELEYWCELSP